MAGAGKRRNSFKAKPASWTCFLDGNLVIDSHVPLLFSCTLPFDADIEYWGQVYSFAEGISIKASALGDRSGITLEFSLMASASVPCSRCLEDAPLDIFGNFRYFYKPLPEIGSEHKEGDESTVFVDSIEGELDISDQIWESLIISLPEKVLCSEGCSGLCPFCGQNRNKVACGCSDESLDPRLEILVEFDQSLNDNVTGEGGNKNGHSKK